MYNYREYRCQGVCCGEITIYFVENQSIELISLPGIAVPRDKIYFRRQI